MDIVVYNMTKYLNLHMFIAMGTNMLINSKIQKLNSRMALSDAEKISSKHNKSGMSAEELEEMKELRRSVKFLTGEKEVSVIPFLYICTHTSPLCILCT